ncbi:hypothetical protein AMOR_39800 [Anaeromyxobacter oryzae]|uniref:Tyr recombinase domain-containing protein n=1 Tax=Anaeromyxobacter oryzae TaxID=2918170 RepID=A0ABM7WZV4_9BACT|nr:hypothetical protein AMOR_39800 [Anaeromyxobacter oryzae]
MKSRVRGLTFRPDGRAVIQWEDGNYRQRQETIPSAGKDGRPLTQKGIEAEAQRRLHEYRERARRERQGIDAASTEWLRRPFSDLIDWWWDVHGKTLKSVAVPIALNKHLRPDLGHLPLRELTTVVFRRWLADKEAAGLAPKTRNHLRWYALNVFELAREQGGPWAGRPNPVADVPRAKVVATPKKILEPAEWSAVLAQVQEEWRGPVALGLYAGLRAGEVFGLRKEDVDLRADIIMVARSWDAPRTKDGKSLPVPVAPGLKPFLVEAMKSPGPFVFPQADGSMQPRDLRLGKMLRAAIREAGVVDGYEHRCRAWRCGWRERHQTADLPEACPRCGKAALWARPLPRHVTFHGTRHSFGTAVVRSAGLAVAQKLLRHSDPRLTANTYTHLDDRDARAAVAAVQAAVDAASTAPALHDPETETAKPPEPALSRAVPRASESGRQDLNLRPLGPEPSALPG